LAVPSLALPIGWLVCDFRSDRFKKFIYAHPGQRAHPEKLRFLRLGEL
jgi:hypothetical protein